MNCTTLPNTGLEPLPLIVAAALILLVGFVLLVRARRNRALAVVAVVAAIALLLLGSPIGTPGAQAASTNCVVEPNSLTIVQTSVNEGMSPSVEPAPITGRVTNNSPDDTYIDDVVVSIFAVTKAAGASGGSCDASDYVIVSPSMPVNAPMAAGASVDFDGALIGFVDKLSNQDACQGATVTLLYSTG